jgi:hypothetical protein
MINPAGRPHVRNEQKQVGSRIAPDGQDFVDQRVTLVAHGGFEKNRSPRLSLFQR